MGKGTIKSGGTDGYYTIDVVRDISAIEDQSRALQDSIERLTQQITTAQATEDEKKSALTAAQSALNDLITEYEDLLTNPQECVRCDESNECQECEVPPCTECPDGHWRIGNRPCVYESQEECEENLPAQLFQFGDAGGCWYETLAACEADNPNWKYGSSGDCEYGTKEECERANDPTAKRAEVDAAAKAVADAGKEWRIAERETTFLELKKASQETLLSRLQAVDETEEVEAWCADFTEDLSGEVALAEVPGQRTSVLIRPGYGGRATYSASRDGVLVPSQGSSKEAVFWNWAMRPGWQRWAPTYRGATITAIDGSTCDITLDAAASTDQDLDVNPAASFEDVTIEYMDCNGDVFAVDDHVLVEFTGQDRTAPKVIGFWDTPVPCTTGYFICIPAADEAPYGWGDPFYDTDTPPAAINPPLGTAGSGAYPAYCESIIKGGATQSYTHLRAGDDYGGAFTQQIQYTNAYGLYDWQGDALGDTLTINTTDGNRYWGQESVRDTEIFFRGFKLCEAYNGQKVVGMGRATFSGTEYLYAVFLKANGADYIDEVFEVWRRVWQPIAYSNNNAYNASTEPLGWEYLDDVDPPSYSSYVPASSGVPQMDHVSDTESGQIGGAAFAPDGTSFLLTYKLVDVGGSGTLYQQWIAGYYEVTISGATGTTITPNIYWNPISQGTGWDYVLAVDYDRDGDLIKLFWEEEYLYGSSSYDTRRAIYIQGGSFSTRLADHCTYNLTSRFYSTLWFAIDLRTCSGVAQYYTAKGNAPADPDEEFGELVLDNGSITRTALVTRGSAVTLIEADGSFSGQSADYALTHDPWTLPEWGNVGWNYAAWDWYGNMLSSYPCNWTEIESHLAWGPGPPTSNGYRNRLSGQSNLEEFLSIDGYTNPGLLYMGSL
jgi:cell division septum initiation protein DivIVA